MKINTTTLRIRIGNLEHLFIWEASFLMKLDLLLGKRIIIALRSENLKKQKSAEQADKVNKTSCEGDLKNKVWKVEC